MKHYVQITAGRGPVECARAVTLVARELLKAFPSLQLADCERSSEHFTDSPVDIWVARTAVSTLLTFCPPLPPERQDS